MTLMYAKTNLIKIVFASHLTMNQIVYLSYLIYVVGYQINVNKFLSQPILLVINYQAPQASIIREFARM